MVKGWGIYWSNTGSGIYSLNGDLSFELGFMYLTWRQVVFGVARRVWGLIAKGLGMCVFNTGFGVYGLNTSLANYDLNTI